MIALANQQAAANGQPPIGFVNPALYAIGKSAGYQTCFHDITTGSNTNNSSPTKYKAVAGYDLCTGLGTPNSGNLITALLAPPSETLVVTPPLGFTAFGPGGGPFTTNSQTYTLKNSGSTPLNWSLVNTSSWLTVSSSSGTLNPGASSTVTISLNPAANNFLIGNFSGNVPIANQTAGTVQNRQFDLYAGNGGFETGGFDDWTYVGDPTYSFALAGDDADVAGEEALPGEPDTLFVHSGIYGAYLGEWPDNGTLSQTVPTTAGQRLLVSFWLTSIPYEGETTPNGFAARWNGSPLFIATNLPAFGWTNLQYVVSSAGAGGTLEFDFNNTPAAFGLDDITVEPVPPPAFQPVALTAGAVKLAWGSYSGLTYQVQSSGSLSNPNWTNIATITATGTLTSASEPFSPNPMQFYRVILLPPP